MAKKGDPVSPVYPVGPVGAWATLGFRLCENFGKDKGDLNVDTKMIITELKQRGYNAIERDIVKNGETVKAVVVKNKFNIAPVFYTDSLIESAEYAGKTLSDVVDYIEDTYKKVKREENFDVDGIMEREYVLEHIRMGVQKESEENVVKCFTEYEGIEKYLYLTVDFDDDSDSDSDTLSSIRVTHELLDRLEVEEEELWEQAEVNTFSETTVTSLLDVMGLADVPGMEECQMLIISNKSKIKGAVAMLNNDFINKLAKEMGVLKFVIIPSSIHECLLVPCYEDYDDETNLFGFSLMVKEVNRTEVKEEEQLSDRAYIFNSTI